MARAKWTTDPRQVSYATGTDGSFVLSIPLLDNGVKQGVMTWRMTADRQMSVVWEQAPGTTPIDFSGGAWVKGV